MLVVHWVRCTTSLPTKPKCNAVLPLLGDMGEVEHGGTRSTLGQGLRLVDRNPGQGGRPSNAGAYTEPVRSEPCTNTLS